MYNRILVPLDGSKLSEGSLAHLNNIVQGNSGIEVILMTIHKPKYQQIFFGNDIATGPITAELLRVREEQDKEREQKIETYLTEIADSLKKESMTVKTHVSRPDPSKGIPEMIIEYAEANKIDLIIMTTHGRSGIKKWAFGSVAEKIVNHSKIPVLIVPPVGSRT
jgi:nucleotide-binding universal stress UspA family protein